mmetsp:Transcript_35455/g.116649  ORF Transcript_35455/g.116649 Transcript_35455/m.116649 type:complete len:249 (-) Transcript_35455:43-789(-)
MRYDRMHQKRFFHFPERVIVAPDQLPSTRIALGLASCRLKHMRKATGLAARAATGLELEADARRGLARLRTVLGFVADAAAVEARQGRLGRAVARRVAALAARVARGLGGARCRRATHLSEPCLFRPSALGAPPLSRLGPPLAEEEFLLGDRVGEGSAAICAPALLVDEVRVGGLVHGILLCGAAGAALSAARRGRFGVAMARGFVLGAMALAVLLGSLGRGSRVGGELGGALGRLERGVLVLAHVTS